MGVHGQLGLFSTESAQQTSVMENAPVTSALSLEVTFNNSPSENKLSPILESIRKEIAKINGELKNFSLVEEKPWFKKTFIALDVETTGLDAASCRVIELAMVPFNASSNNNFSQLFSTGEPLPPEITRITGISDEMLDGQPHFGAKAQQILELLKDADFIVAYNAKFDRPFLESELARVDMALPDIPWVDPYIFICELDRYKKGKKLVDAAQRWGVTLNNAHRAQADAQAAGELLQKISNKIEAVTLANLLEQQKILSWKQAHSMAEYKKASAWSINR